MSVFIVNIPLKPQAISLRWSRVHLSSCRYIERSRGRLRYSISAAEVLRLHSRILRGDGGRVWICRTCRPDRVAGFREDAT